MSKRSSLFVPEPLKAYADDTFYDAIERFGAMRLDEFISGMPEVQLVNRYSDKYPAIDVAVIKPEEYNPKEAVLLPYPFGNGHAPHMHIRALVMQAVLGGDKQVVCFPNNTARETHYSLPEIDRKRIAAGNPTPLASGMLAAVRELKIERVDIINYSQPNFFAPN